MNEEEDVFEGLRNKLLELDYPTTYLFKFIFPVDQLEKVKQLFNNQNNYVIKPSKAGNYLSLSYATIMPSAESIIDIYKQASVIKGVISL
ncbi:MAG: DUF493 family protein [Cytophagales bacterium]|nr:MAG: DUF493 family protein [Cytophagales bacterium]